METGQQLRPGFYENDACLCRINVPEIAFQRKARQFSGRPGKLYSCGPAADEHEGQQAPSKVRIGAILRVLKRK